MCDYSKLPAHLQGGMQRYIEQGIRPGSFLRAVLANDISTAIAKADPDSYTALCDICLWIGWNVPEEATGSYQAIEDWCAEQTTEVRV